MEDVMMHEVRPVRKQFDIWAHSEPQLERRLHWFGRALALRNGYIVAVQRTSGEGRHVASIAYEVPLPAQRSRRQRPSHPSSGLTRNDLTGRDQIGRGRDVLARPAAGRDDLDA
jgi:hypothetical protein